MRYTQYMELFYFESEQEVQRRCAQNIAQIIRGAESQPVLVLYSGGSGLKVMQYLYEALVDVDLHQVIFAPLDERLDIQYSNAKAFAEMESARLFMERGATLVDIGDVKDGLIAVADRYEEQIKDLIEDIQDHEGVIISLLGMGTDGHTAGMFPYPEDMNFFEETFLTTSQFVVGYDVGDKNQYPERITLTLAALEQADYSFVYVTGAEKEAVLKRAFGEGKIAEIPARLWKDLPKVKIFTNCVVE